MYRTDNWINEGSGWIVELIESQYINVSIYRLLSGSSYVKLPAELKSPKKGLINMKNNDQKCFLWCHVRHTNPVKIHPERELREKIKNLLIVLIMMRLGFLFEKKILARLKKRTIFVLMCFVTKIGWLFQFTFQIKDFNRSMFYKTKNKNKKYFCKSCLQCFSSKNVLTKQRRLFEH